MFIKSIKLRHKFLVPFSILILIGFFSSCSMPGAWDLLRSIENEGIDPLTTDPETPPENWRNGWDNRVLLNINSTAASNLLNYPLMVQMGYSGIDLNSIKPDGSDILFVSYDGNTDLSHELEGSWDSMGNPKLWVNIPVVEASGTTQIWMYYSSTSETGGMNASAVWDPAYQGVWHLNETSLPFENSAGPENTVLPGSWMAPSIQNGLFSGKGMQITSPDHGLSAGDWGVEADALTLSFWFLQNGITASKKLFQKGDLTLEIVDGANTLGVKVLTKDNSYLYKYYDPLDWTATDGFSSSWITVTWSGNQLTSDIKLYCNGLLLSSFAFGNGNGLLYDNSGSGPLYIGNSSNGGDGILGYWDDIQLSDTVRSGDWINTTWKAYENSLIVYGAPQSAP